ncbi:MAG: cobyric acid synthase [Deltaproteobacteria bacterium]|nr:cobyric acid synthase [Deltaproteobacteria bacterium]
MKNDKARPIMVQGTSSHVGKSVLCAALCRIFRDAGLRVAPFKAQNMALNSAVTADGGEIGRAQAHQAEAAGIAPTIDMNPILLKPTADRTSQVIIHGRVHGVMSAVEYHAFKKEAARYVIESYERLASAYDVVVIEGAGSPAEINLRENDLANMGIAEMADSPVILAGDIDRGGVFAALVGTIELLTPQEKARLTGFIINKFRGDIDLLKPGLSFLTERTKLPVLGVVPYMKDIMLPDEDGVGLETRARARTKADGVRIAIITLPRISNFTDFDPFRAQDGVTLTFIEDPSQIDGTDCVIIPGSKNTLEDLRWLVEKGFGERLQNFRHQGQGMLVGICGGFQMLGRTVSDPHGMESDLGTVAGLGLLDVETTLSDSKKTFQVTAEAAIAGESITVAGYEIHMGETSGADRTFSIINRRNNTAVAVRDGATSKDGMVWGTYIHGIFDSDEFRGAFLNRLRAIKGRAPGPECRPFAASADAAITAFAKTVRENLDMEKIMEMVGR